MKSIEDVMVEIQKLKMDLRALQSQMMPVRNRIDDLEGATNFVEGEGVGITKTKTATIFDAEASSGSAVGAGSNFLEIGIVKVAGVTRPFTFSDADKAADNLWLRVYFDGSTPLPVQAVSDASTDAYESYRIRVGGVTVRYDDIIESRT